MRGKHDWCRNWCSNCWYESHFSPSENGFLMLAMNQIVNMASKIHYISDGKMNVPIVIRACI